MTLKIETEAGTQTRCSSSVPHAAADAARRPGRAVGRARGSLPAAREADAAPRTGRAARWKSQGRDDTHAPGLPCRRTACPTARTRC